MMQGNQLRSYIFCVHGHVTLTFYTFLLHLEGTSIEVCKTNKFDHVLTV